MFLDQILASVKTRVQNIQGQSGWFFDRALELPPVRSLAAALREHRGMPVGVIAECKQKSPSKGWLTHDYQPAAQALGYERQGAHAVSVLTEPEFFAGHLADLQKVKAAVHLPVLRKDFVIDPVQIFEGRAMGADAILVIIRIVDDAQLHDLAQAARAVGIEMLVEVHAANELERALKIDPMVVGINNRDLDTFETRLEFSLEMAPLMPKTVVKVSESGIQTRQDVDRLHDAGYSAILVGEHLMRGGTLLEDLRHE
ncbi:indole-3-glycerol phosphate synthase TrpC [Sulfobacillus sp. hq2]|uniref:indole-3-glycerol-phosphate synthase n=1 Tax=Sulfobacillus thermotolerans TaxID=338644 RepID=A0ABM6RSR4_9FIRM|nr:indole-3-glycerol phosphate synthase TrpC [Sulfobacillus sp. hq2]AUW94485.1 indole-3-glycerol phosphate synthase [Sulfobacillus thermotolerans]MCY0908520.1 indole-3-glycerol phosphate synthase TrpC [Sulfobacillus thermotolerans]POB09219.1 indole-3-glycerol phosphate synthase [Sulfobacillus sp. hq2]